MATSYNLLPAKSILGDLILLREPKRGTLQKNLNKLEFKDAKLVFSLGLFLGYDDFHQNLSFPGWQVFAVNWLYCDGGDVDSPAGEYECYSDYCYCCFRCYCSFYCYRCTAVDFICTDPDIRAISFVGSNHVVSLSLPSPLSLLFSYLDVSCVHPSTKL